MDRPPDMDLWRTRADYTVAKDGRLELNEDAEHILGAASCTRWRKKIEDERVADTVTRVVRVAYARRVIPIRCGSRIHVPGRLIPGWGRLKPAERKHEGGWLAVMGALSFAMGSDQESRFDGEWVGRLGLEWPACNQVKLIEALTPMCIQAPTDELFVHGWMEPGELEALSVSLEAAMAGSTL